MCNRTRKECTNHQGPVIIPLCLFCFGICLCSWDFLKIVKTRGWRSQASSKRLHWAGSNLYIRRKTIGECFQSVGLHTIGETVGTVGFFFIFIYLFIYWTGYHGCLHFFSFCPQCELLCFLRPPAKFYFPFPALVGDRVWQKLHSKLTLINILRESGMYNQKPTYIKK